MWFKKEIKNLNSEEYLELKRLINVITLDVELLNQRYKRKIKPLDKEEDSKNSINDILLPDR